VLNSRTEDIALHYASSNRFSINNGQSLLIRFPNQHLDNYGDILLLPSLNLAPGYSSLVQELQHRLPRLGWHFFVLFHDTNQHPITQEDYIKLINETIEFTQQQSANPLFVIAIDQSALTLINLASQQLPSINGAALILPSNVTDDLSYPTGWPIPLLVFTQNRFSPILFQLRKISPRVVNQSIIHENLRQSTAPLMGQMIHGWFKKHIRKQ
jgi:hypothetical protein